MHSGLWIRHALQTVLLAGLTLSTAPVFSTEPGRGLTAQFEIEFMKFTLDHHFAALRITELAAGDGPTTQRTDLDQGGHRIYTRFRADDRESFPG